MLLTMHDSEIRACNFYAFKFNILILILDIYLARVYVHLIFKVICDSL